MKKRIPELLARFNKIKETGGLSNSANCSNHKSSLERSLLEKLFQMGDNDFHSINGIVHESGKEGALSSAETTGKTTSVELKGFNSFSRVSDFESIHVKQEYTQSQSNCESVNIKKLMEDVTFNNETFDDIRNYIRKNNLDIPIENLDLRNPEHLKQFEQLYSADVLKNVLKKSQPVIAIPNNKTANKKTSRPATEVENSHSSEQSAPYSSERKCHKKHCRHRCSGRHQSGSSKSSRHIPDSHESHHQNHIESHREKPQERPVKNQYFGKYGGFTNSPILPKDAYFFASPRQASEIKDDPFPAYDYYFQDENVNLSNFTLPKSYGYNADQYLFGSPLPSKKAKVEHHSDMLDLNSTKLKENNSRMSNMPDWLGNSSNKKTRNNNIIHNNNSMFMSPKPLKYESPSRYCANSFHPLTIY